MVVEASSKMAFKKRILKFPPASSDYKNIIYKENEKKIYESIRNDTIVSNLDFYDFYNFHRHIEVNISISRL